MNINRTWGIDKDIASYIYADEYDFFAVDHYKKPWRYLHRNNMYFKYSPDYSFKTFLLSKIGFVDIHFDLIFSKGEYHVETPTLGVCFIKYLDSILADLGNQRHLSFCSFYHVRSMFLQVFNKKLYYLIF